MDAMTFFTTVVVPILTGLAVGIGVSWYKDRREDKRRREDLKRADRDRLNQMERASEERQLQAVYDFLTEVETSQADTYTRATAIALEDIPESHKVLKRNNSHALFGRQLDLAIKKLDLAIIHPKVRKVIPPLVQLQLEYLKNNPLQKDPTDTSSRALGGARLPEGSSDVLNALRFLARTHLNRAPELGDEFAGMYTPPPAGAPLDK